MRDFLKYAAFCLSVLFLSCAKDTPAPDGNPEEAIVPITEISTVHYSNVTTDTVWVTMDAVEMNFDKPVEHLDLGDPFEEVKDSIQIDITLPISLELSQELLLPNLHISDPYVWFNVKSDALFVDKFPFEEGFRSQQQPEVNESYDGLISKIIVNRKYQRIYYNADVSVMLLDDNGSSYIEEGTFVGSKMGRTSTEVQVW